MLPDQTALAGAGGLPCDDPPLDLLGHDEIHKMVKFAFRNPKLEFRNPKQIQNPNFQITKTHRLQAGAFLVFNLGHLTLFRISSFGFRV